MELSRLPQGPRPLRVPGSAAAALNPPPSTSPSSDSHCARLQPSHCCGLFWCVNPPNSNGCRTPKGKHQDL